MFIKVPRVVLLMMAGSRRSVVVLLSVAVLASSPAAAQDEPLILLPPGDFQGSYNSTTQQVNLSWQPPAEGTAFQFNVYRDGDLVTTTGRLNFTESIDLSLVAGQAFATYYVTAVAQDGDHEGEESPPTRPYVVSSQSSGPSGGSDGDGSCPIVSTSTEPDPPFVGANVHEECVPGSGGGGPQNHDEPEDEGDAWPCPIVSTGTTPDPPFVGVDVHEECIPGSGGGVPQLPDDVPLLSETEWRIMRSQ